MESTGKARAAPFLGGLLWMYQARAKFRSHATRERPGQRHSKAPIFRHQTLGAISGLSLCLASTFCLALLHFICSRLPPPSWDVPGAFMGRSWEGQIWERGRISAGYTPQSPPCKVAIFSRGTNLCLLEVSCNSGKSPASTWRMATIAVCT